MLFKVCTSNRKRYMLVAKSLEEFCTKAKQLLKLGNFDIVLEEDGSILPDEVLTDIIEEGVPMQLLMLLQESERWTPQETALTVSAEPSLQTASVSAPSPSPDRLPNVTTACNLSTVYPVAEVLAKYDKGNVKGPDLVRQLLANQIWTRTERVFTVKVLGKYLMKNALVTDQPSKIEKTRMAESIVSTFPVLKYNCGNGYEPFYDPVSRTGFLESYIRQRRSRCPDIITRHFICRNKTVVEENMNGNDNDVIESSLRERRPTAGNMDELLELLKQTRTSRREWIESSKPTISEIFKKYPRLTDVPNAIHEEFCSMHPMCEINLRDVWPRDAILRKAIEKAATNKDLGAIMETTSADVDEDVKSLVSFKVLPFFLPTPPKRGLKRQRLSPLEVIEKLYVEIENVNIMDEAVKQLNSNNCLQPVLFKFNDMFWVKTDNSAVPVPHVSCIADAFDYLFRFFWVVNVEYPIELRLVFGFFENLLRLKPTVGKSVAITEFMRAVLPSP